MQKVEDILNKLYDYYEVSGASELAKIIGVSPQVIYSWKVRNSINPLKNKIRELDLHREGNIYKEIFGEVVLRNASDLVDRLMEYYDVDTLSELAEILDVTQPTISKWKARKAIIPIKNKCKELGIYEEIFNDLEFSEFDKIKILKQQCKKYDISTNFFIYDIKKTLNIIETMIKNNKKIEDKFHQYLKDFIKDNL